MQLETLLRKEKAFLCKNTAECSGSKLISDGMKDSGNACCGQISPRFSLFLGKKRDMKVSEPKIKGTIQTFISERSKSQHLLWYRGASVPMALGDLHMCEGTIDTKACIGILERHAAINTASMFHSGGSCLTSYCLQRFFFLGSVLTKKEP